MKKKINIALIGCGRVAEHYKYVFNKIKNKNYVIVAVVDTNSEKAELFGKHFKCKYYTNFKKMIKDLRPDLNIILTPSGSHYSHSKISLELKCHTITEKPISMTPKQAKKLNEISKKNKLMFGCVFQNRFNPAIKFLEKILKKNLFGKILTSSVRLRWCRYQDYYEDEWHGSWLNDGGVINQQSIHHLDIVNWLIGPIKEVSCYNTNILNKLEAEDTSVCILNFENGSLGTFEATTSARPRDQEASLSILFEKGLIEIGGIGLNKINKLESHDRKFNISKIKKENSQKIKTGYGLGHIPFFESVINSLSKSSIIPPIDVQDCISTTELVHSIYYSYENRKSCKISSNKISKKLGRRNK